MVFDARRLCDFRVDPGNLTEKPSRMDAARRSHRVTFR